jgi:organic radical activating enzyme
MNIIPTYKCNFNCPFCYTKKLSDKELLDLNWLKNQLNKIPDINNIDILGGELSILPIDYQKQLIDICTEKLNGKKPQMITNLKIVTPFIYQIDPVVSYDINLRQDSEIVLSNLIKLDTEYDINMIVTQEVINKGPEYILKFTKKLRLLKQLRLSSFKLLEGIQYYYNLIPEIKEETEKVKEKMKSALSNIEAILRGIQVA